MARPKKETVEYFPHFCDNGKTMFIIENHFGNDGYAFWFKLLEILGKSKKHYYDCRNDTSIEFLSAKTRLMPTLCIQILDKLAQLDAIDSELWQKRIVFSQNFINNISDAYNRSNEKPFSKNGLCIHLFGNCTQNEELKSEDETISASNSTENTQTILDNIILKERKKKEEFEIFWNLYGKKIGKPQSLKLWLKLSDEEKKLALNYIPFYKKGKEKRFLKDPERFIQKKCWNDELVSAEGSSNGEVKHTGYVIDPNKFYNREGK